VTVPSHETDGVEAIVAMLIREYRSMGHTVALIAKENSAVPVDQRFIWPTDDVSGFLNTWKNARALRAAVDAFSPDVLHSFSRLAYLLLLLPSSVAKVMSFQQRPDAKQVRWSRRFSRGTLRFTGSSEYLATVGRRGGGKWRAIPNFVDVENYPFVPAVAPNAPLLFLSRLDSINAPHLAIAIARKAERPLILAGERNDLGDEADYFNREIAPHLGRDGIEWLGAIDHAQKVSLLSRAAALLVPIQWDNPFGAPFVEALATGCPVITCARGALPEIITPNRTGFFITNTADGVRAVSQLATLDRAGCRADVVNQFSVRACAEQYLALYVEMNTPIHE